MRLFAAASLLLFASSSFAAPPVCVAPFTDADYASGSVRMQLAAGSTACAGTVGKGVRLAAPAILSGLQLNPAEGIIGAWIRPNWDGSDGKRHRIWALDATGGRRLVLAKSELGMLRAELTTPTGMTVARADVSGWQSGQWRHVAVGWISHADANVGLALWVDKVAVDGPITPHGVFDAASLPTTMTLGDAGASTDLDELVVRPNIKAEGGYGMVACIYRDFFRGAPYDAIRVDHQPCRTPSDRRAVAGLEKVFGLQARRAGVWEPVTEQVVRYSQWAYFDAKPMIRWSTSNPSVATIDDKGRLKALIPGKCTVVAQFHGMRATYPLTVIGADRPDLAFICTEMLPRYRSDAVKDRPAAGETVTLRVRFGSFGSTPTPASARVRLSLTPETTGDYRLGADDKPRTFLEQAVGRELAPGEEDAVEFRIPYPARSTWMKVELDPTNAIDELCEANNGVAELSDARPVQMGYAPKVLRECLSDRKMNHVGSLSYYDWLRAEVLRMDVMLREAVWPTTGPHGVEEAYRIDAFTPLAGGNWDDEPYNKQMVYFDGGFPVNEPVDLMAIDCAIIHEFGHTILSQPDLYGYPVSASNVLITDDAGKPVAGTPVLPVVQGRETLPASPGVNVPCYVGYPSLMDGCQLWLHPSQAGHVMYFRGYRQDRFWGTQGRLIPTRANWLLVTDANDRPLKGAAVAVYHVSQAPVQDSGAKYFADRPKFIGRTDDEGRFTFPNDTDEDWDDPETDEVDGSKPVWNPFGTPASETAFTPNVWEVEGLLLLKIVSGDQVEFRFMDLTQFNEAFLAGERVVGKYAIRTSLLPSDKPSSIVRKPVPEAVRKVNKKPVAVIPEEMTVKCGEEFVIDGSKSHDPEGQPLVFRWNVGEGWLMGNLSQSATLKQKAPNEPKTLEYKLWVIDGVRCSDAAVVKVKVVR